jgi:branched-chain amino acid transport system substrate-binding protein
MTKTHKVAIIIAIIILIPIVIYFIGFSGAQQSNDESITIGATLSINGVSAIYGSYNQKGMELALAEINQQGGIDGKELKIILEDTQSLPTTAVNAIQKLIDFDNVSVILASALSPETIAQAPIAEEKQRVLIASGSAAPKIREAGDYIFRVKVAVDVEIKELMEFTQKELEAKTIYILYVQNDYGEGIRQSADKYWQEIGGQVIGSEGFDIKETDFRTFLLKAKSANPDVIVLGGWASNMGWIMTQAKELGIETQMVAPAGTIGPELLEIAGTAADGLIYNTEFNLNSEREVVQNFRIKYKEKYNEDPELFAALGYDSTMIIAEMLKICGSNATCIKDELYKVQDYEGASGVISFDANGDVIKPLIYMTIKDGVHVRYEK